MNFHVEITDLASNDLDDRLLSTVEWAGHDVARRLRLAWLATLDRLAFMPTSHALADFDLTPPVRYASFGPGKRKTYLVYFRVADDVVQVLRVRAAAERPLTADEME